jgi:glutamine amidotransferase
MTNESPLLAGLQDGDYVYFVHSYAAPVGPWTIATTDYGGEFSAAVQHENFHGVQFHPERSAQAGSRVLANFLGLS